MTALSRSLYEAITLSPFSVCAAKLPPDLSMVEKQSLAGCRYRCCCLGCPGQEPTTQSQLYSCDQAGCYRGRPRRGEECSTRQVWDKCRGCCRHRNADTPTEIRRRCLAQEHLPADARTKKPPATPLRNKHLCREAPYSTGTTSSRALYRPACVQPQTTPNTRALHTDRREDG